MQEADDAVDGILFEIRVLVTRSPDQADGPKRAEGASI
jgi:hypothetical protein